MPVKSYIVLAYWMKVIGAFLAMLTVLVLLIFAIDLLVRRFSPMPYKRLSARWGHGIERTKERILRVVLPIYIAGLLAIFVMQISNIWPRLFWPACVLSIVFLEVFYLIEKHRSGRD